ncbi:MAG: TrkH family potassium uptake protein, partial [Candidatus Latescibacteria bacterium]|nr:TrkH family potassium uptake protein [Candidatus Latescibacterota bacterium]
VTAVTAVIATLNNIGPGLGLVGPVDNFSSIPDAGKYLLSLCMVLGRLELFAVLVLFMPAFWRGH